MLGRTLDYVEWRFIKHKLSSDMNSTKRGSLLLHFAACTIKVVQYGKTRRSSRAYDKNTPQSGISLLRSLFCPEPQSK